MVIFDSAQRIINNNFGKGVNIRLSRAERSDLDRAWHCGFSAGQEDGVRALPPADFNDAMVGAFFAGVDAAAMGEWSNEEIEERARQAEWEDKLACGFVGA